jgi:ferrous iron transport protein B
MGARTINSAKERLITILIAPWMSCTARIPVYTTILALLLPDTSTLLKSCIMLGIYSTGIITSLIAARLLRSRIKEDKSESHFMLELPPYRKPQLGYLLRHVVDRGMAFLKRAGTVILGISILLWALQTYPKPKDGSPAANDSALALEQSFMGQIGKGVEPVVEPLGYDWRTGTAVMASFAAREVFVSNLAITFHAENEDEELQDEKLQEKLAAATWPDGRKLYTPLTLISLLVFFIYALQCFPTTVVVMRETNSWKWALGQLVGMSLFAYVAALLVYQIGKLLGYA